MDTSEFLPSRDDSETTARRFRTLRALFEARGGSASPVDRIEELAAQEMISPERLAALAKWVDRAVRHVESGLPLRLCVNVSCRQNGAEELRIALQAAIRTLGSPVTFENVQCLENCAFGPCAAVSTSIFRGGAGDCRDDSRPWRREPDPPAAG